MKKLFFTLLLPSFLFMHINGMNRVGTITRFRPATNLVSKHVPGLRNPGTELHPSLTRNHTPIRIASTAVDQDKKEKGVANLANKSICPRSPHDKLSLQWQLALLQDRRKARKYDAIKNYAFSIGSRAISFVATPPAIAAFLVGCVGIYVAPNDIMFGVLMSLAGFRISGECGEKAVKFWRIGTKYCNKEKTNRQELKKINQEIRAAKKKLNTSTTNKKETQIVK